MQIKMKKNELIGSNLNIIQEKSTIKLTKSQRSSLIGLGLKKIGSVVKLQCNEVNYGMIKKVIHLLKITKI
jgi:ribosomal protein L30